VNEAFEDSAPLRDVLLAVCREFGLAHAARRLEPPSAAEHAGPEDADMPDAGGAGTNCTAADGDDDGDQAEESEEESDGDDEEDDDLWSAAERDDKDMMVCSYSSCPPANSARACLVSRCKRCGAWISTITLACLPLVAVPCNAV